MQTMREDNTLVTLKMMTSCTYSVQSMREDSNELTSDIRIDDIS